MTEGEQDFLAVPRWIKWLVEMRWPLVCVVFFWAGEFVGYHIDRPARGEIICSSNGNAVNHISMHGIRQDNVPDAVEAIVNAVCHRGVRV